MEADDKSPNTRKNAPPQNRKTFQFTQSKRKSLGNDGRIYR